MKKNSKKISSFLVLALILSVFLPNVALANSTQDYLIKDKNFINEEMAPQSVVTVLVYVGGILSGYIIEGVIIYASGQSAGDWVADAFEYLAQHPSATIIRLPSGGGGGGGW